MFATARQLAALLAQRELSAVEVMRAFLAQIERVNPRVNAIVSLRPPSELLAEAAAADRRLAAGEPVGPLHGLPIAIKDLSLTRGLRTTFGSTLYRDFVPTSDELYVDAPAPRRRHRHRQDEHAGVRRGLADVQRAVRRDAQSVRPDARPAAAAAAERPSRSRAACCRSPTAPISAARCAIRRASATSSVSGRRRGVCRDSTRAPATRSACTARWRATSTISRCCCPSWRDPTRAIRCRCRNLAARFAASPQRDFAGTRVAWSERLGRYPVEPAVTAVCNAARSVFGDARLRRRRRRARSRRCRRAVPNAARGRLRGALGRDLDARPRASSRTPSSGTSSKGSS